MALFQDAITFLVAIGLLDVILPFFLVFTLVYAMLQRTRVLGSENGKPRSPLNAVLAFCLAFLAVASLQQVEFIKAFSAVIGVAVIVVLVLVMTMGLVGAKTGSKILTMSGITVAIIGLVIMLGTLGWLPKDFSDLTSRQFGIPFLVILAFFLVGWYIVSSGEKESKNEKKDERTKEPKTVELGAKELDKPGMIWEGK